MKFYAEQIAAFGMYKRYTMIWIYYLDIGIAHICAVAIFKYVIFAAYSMRFYAEAA